MKNHGADEEVHAMFDMGAETLALPLEEKIRFEQGDSGYSFGSVTHPVASYSHRSLTILARLSS